MKILATLLAALDWQSRAVLLRHLRVYLKNWYTAFLPPATEPVVLLLAFGLGLGAHVSGIDGSTSAGESVDYASYIAPGILAYTAFMTPFFQALFGAFIRMHYQKTWEGQLTTQIELPHVIWGEILWAALLGTMYTAIVAVVIAICALCGVVSVSLPGLLASVPLAFLFGIGFGSLALTFTAWLPSIDHMNLPIFLLVIPMGFASNTYFPIPENSIWIYWLLQANPLYHLAEFNRELLLGRGIAVWHIGVGLLEAALLALVLVPMTQRKLRRRVLGDG